MGFKIVENSNTQAPVPKMTKPVAKMPLKKLEVEPEPQEVWQVVAKLPVQEIRRYEREDGVIVNLMTLEEFATQQMNDSSE